MDYLNLTEDLPQRCRVLLINTLPTARQKHVEVTQLLMVASLGFVTPFELLRPNSNDKARDSGRGANLVIKNAGGLLEKAFYTSPFMPTATPKHQLEPLLEQYEPGTWRYGKVALEELTKPADPQHPRPFQAPEQWPDWDTQILTDPSVSLEGARKNDALASPTTNEILSIMRNALAHGHIRTAASSGNIDTIVFLSKVKNRHPEEGFYYLGITPNDFLAFLLAWFVFLESNTIQKILQDRPFMTDSEVPAA